MQIKLYRYTFAAYSAVLLVSLALFYLFPKDVLIDLNFDTNSAVESEIYFEAEIKGELDQIEGIYPYKQWSFDYEGDSLKIVKYSSNSNPRIVAKRTAAGSGEITAVEYRRETFVTHRLKPYRISLTGNRLDIYCPEPYEFNFKGFGRDFTADQFRKGKDVQYHLWLHHEFEYSQELYLNIPADVKIEHDPEMFIIIVDDEEIPE